MTLYLEGGRMRSLNILSVFLFIFFLNSVTAQSDSSKTPEIVVTLKNGKTFIGNVASSEKTHISILTVNNKTVRIAKDSIDGIIRFDNLSSRQQKQLLNSTVDLSVKNPVQYTQSDTTVKEYIEDLKLSRLVLFPSARPMNPWQGYVQLNELFFPFAALSIYQLFVIGGGASVIPGYKDQIIYFSARVTPYHYKNLFVAGGVFYVNSTKNAFSSEFYKNGVALGYGMFTYGDGDKSITAGLGYNLRNEYGPNKPVLIIGGDFRIARNLKIITENWIPPQSDDVVSSLGLRFLGKHGSGDFVLIRRISQHYKPSEFIPYFNYTYNFNLFSTKE